VADDQFHFEGFGEPYFTRMPDVLFDDLLPRLSEAELKVLLYIIRRTFGFKKSADDISLKQLAEGITTRDGKVLDHGTGLSRPSVTRGVKGLEEKGIVVAMRNATAERGDLPTTYRLRFKDEPGGVKNLNTGGVNILTTGRQESQHGGVKDLYPQETVEQDTDLQETEDDSNHTPPLHIASKIRTPHLDQLLRDLSVAFHDTAHTPQNITQVRRLHAASRLT
jgi:hypothetical protein